MRGIYKLKKYRMVRFQMLFKQITFLNDFNKKLRNRAMYLFIRIIAVRNYGKLKFKQADTKNRLLR